MESNPFNVVHDPATGEIIIYFSESTSANISIFDIAGRRQLEVRLKNQKQINFPVADFPGGIYFIRISESNQIRTKKIVLM